MYRPRHFIRNFTLFALLESDNHIIIIYKASNSYTLAHIGSCQQLIQIYCLRKCSGSQNRNQFLWHNLGGERFR